MSDVIHYLQSKLSELAIAIDRKDAAIERLVKENTELKQQIKQMEAPIEVKGEMTKSEMIAQKKRTLALAKLYSQAHKESLIEYHTLKNQ